MKFGLPYTKAVKVTKFLKDKVWFAKILSSLIKAYKKAKFYELKFGLFRCCLIFLEHGKPNFALLRAYHLPTLKAGSRDFVEHAVE